MPPPNHLPSQCLPILHTSILIIGSSMVGMTLSALLAQHGVQDCLTIEKHSSTAIHPRAALFHPRTMQIYRELGLYERMQEESLKYYDDHAGLHAVESLAGKKLGTWMKDINEGLEGIVPVDRDGKGIGRMFLTQQMFEPLLKEHVLERGGSLRFSTELVEFEQDDGGVTALIRSRETGEKYIVRANYMVACDGSKSLVRRKLGIGMKGHGLLSKSITIYFKADLGRFVEGKYNGVIYVNNDSVRGFFRLDKTGTEGFLVVNTFGKRGTEESRFPGVDITEGKAGEMLRAAIGADVEFEITLLSPWDALCDVAERFNDRRVILAGDACHNNTPNGGFGGNTGIQDAHNLAWKLSLVMQGKASEELVTSTYHNERHPVVKKTVAQVFERYVVRTTPDLRTDDMVLEEEVPEPHLELGYRYHSRGLTTSELGYVTSDPRTAKAMPGGMAHHVMIRTTGEPGHVLSIADLLGWKFVLIVGHQGSGWAVAAKSMFEDDLPSIEVHQLTEALENDNFYDRYAVSPGGCVLIRPDGFIAWSEHKPAVSGMASIGIPGPEATLRCVMRQVLCWEELGSEHARRRSEAEDSAVVVPEAEMTMAEKLHSRRSKLKKEREVLQARLDDIDERLKEVDRLDSLQNEMTMLQMKMGLVARDGPD